MHCFSLSDLFVYTAVCVRNPDEVTPPVCYNYSKMPGTKHAHTGQTHKSGNTLQLKGISYNSLFAFLIQQKSNEKYWCWIYLWHISIL